MSIQPVQRVYVYNPGPKPKLDPPPQRARVLDYVRKQIKRGRPFPSHVDAGHHLGMHPSTVLDAYCGLEQEGHLRRLGRAREGRKQILWELVP